MTTRIVIVTDTPAATAALVQRLNPHLDIECHVADDVLRCPRCELEVDTLHPDPDFAADYAAGVCEDCTAALVALAGIDNYWESWCGYNDCIQDFHRTGTRCGLTHELVDETE